MVIIQPNKKSSIRILFESNKLFISSVFLAILFAYLISDYYGPPEIFLKADSIMGMPVYRVENEELIVQEFDKQGNLWVTRGMWAYKMKPRTYKFVRQFHIPTGASIFWLRNFSSIRRLTLRPECIELLLLPEGNAVAMSAGRIWYRAGHKDKFRETLKLRHYGIGIGQGIRNDGWDRLNDGRILLGEYFMNKNRSDVRLLSSQDYGQNWQVVQEFPPGTIRHIHAIQQDPYEEKAWILTGDNSHEPMVAWTVDGGKSINRIGQGSQKWRVTQLVFTKDALFWGADTSHPKECGIYRYDRKSKIVNQISAVKGVVLYSTRLASGTTVMSTHSTDKIGTKGHQDIKTKLIIMRNDSKVSPLVFGERNSRRKFAKLRLQRRQGEKSLVISVLNHQEYNNDLLILPEYSLKMLVDRNLPKE